MGEITHKERDENSKASAARWTLNKILMMPARFWARIARNFLELHPIAPYPFDHEWFLERKKTLKQEVLP